MYKDQSQINHNAWLWTKIMSSQPEGYTTSMIASIYKWVNHVAWPFNKKPCEMNFSIEGIKQVFEHCAGQGSVDNTLEIWWKERD